MMLPPRAGGSVLGWGILGCSNGERKASQEHCCCENSEADHCRLHGRTENQSSCDQQRSHQAVIFVPLRAAMPTFRSAHSSKVNTQTAQSLCGQARMEGRYRAVEMAHAHKPEAVLV
jgi:hypothetical protein